MVPARLIIDCGGPARKVSAGSVSPAGLPSTVVAGKVVDRCIQMFGGLGVAREMPLERWYREMRIRRVGEGPSEVQRMVIAREILGSNLR